MLLTRFAPSLAALASFVFFAIGLITQHRQTLLFVSIGSVVVVIGIGAAICWGRVSIAKATRLLFSPVLVVVSTWLFLTALELTAVTGLLWWVSLLAAIAIGVYLYVIVLYLYARPRYQAHALENIANYLNVVSVFFVASGMGIVRIYLSFSWWIAPVTVLVVAVCAWWHVMAISDIAFSSAWLYGGISSLVLAEVILAAFALPTSIYVPATTIAVSYYLISGSSRNWLLHITERTAFTRYAAIGITIIVVALLTARWTS